MPLKIISCLSYPLSLLWRHRVSNKLVGRLKKSPFGSPESNARKSTNFKLNRRRVTRRAHGRKRVENWKPPKQVLTQNDQPNTQPGTLEMQTLKAPRYCAISFSIPRLFTQPQWLMVRKLFLILISFIRRTKGRLVKKCVELLMLRTTYYRLRELKGVYRSLLSCVRCIGERKQLMIMFIM